MRLLTVLLVLALGFASRLLHAEQTCSPDMPLSRPDNRYALSLDGTEVLDKATGLIWQRCSLGQAWDGAGCSGAADTFTWEDALAAAYGEWRVPNLKELRSLVEPACVPAINDYAFPDTPTTEAWEPAIHYWSSSPFAQNVLQAWGVNFTNGTDYPGTARTYPMWVRLVRDGD